MNFLQVGFIHTLFPNALILHIIRDPMYVVFSCSKVEIFKAQDFHLTSDFRTLAIIYASYRKTFHKKKHAVNNYSNTQVRKGVYKTAIKAWKKYEKQMQALRTYLAEFLADLRTVTKS